MLSANKTIDEVLFDLPRREQTIVRRLRNLVLECLPFATEKMMYGVPFYTQNRMICFIWPPSISWGKKKYSLETRGVTLGFCQGNKMANPDGILLAENRKQVHCIYFKSLKEINDDQLRAFLYEADMIDGTFRKMKKK
ncbi:DUF1801 domain-containing protein [Chryseolinea lacunae]|uniref:DUF1801 domain-containing protein n=1 Tax=Chryseolinea lacunae TaxID=2801331 RepID=A0ABS1KVE8_9BACT|nr:DUF1801 domain-containing protein [Chryseolinea lacunae]MBL0743446.1 DUF1801 domain-containing protein [Chryseolinea lacunae]